MSDLPLLPLPTRADPADATAPRLLIIYTGGTVGMALNDSGELVPMEFVRLDQQMPDLARMPFRLQLLSLRPPSTAAMSRPPTGCFWPGSLASTMPVSMDSSSCTAPIPWPTRPRR